MSEYMPVLKIMCVAMLPPLLYSLVFLNGWVPKKLRKCFEEANGGLLSIHNYVCIVYFHNVFSTEFTEEWLKWVVIIGAIVSAASLVGTIRLCMNLSYTERFQRRLGVSFGIFIVGLFVMVLMCAAIINYASFVAYPDLYLIPEGLNHWELAFEFVYYSFMLMVTFNGATIAPVHIISKLLQMAEIIVFFTCVSIVLSDLFVKVRVQELERFEKEMDKE